MSVIDLPTSPSPAKMTPRTVSKGGDLLPIFAGADLSLGRMGDKWAMTFDMPPMDYETAMAWVARLSRGLKDSVRMAIPQPGLEMRGRSGSVLVKGAGQAGTSLEADGGNQNYPVREGQWVSIITSGRSYAYMLGADTRFDSSGEATLTLDPMLRRSPADDDPVEIENPIIEGRLEGRAQEWTIDAARHVGLSFTIIERA